MVVSGTVGTRLVARRRGAGHAVEGLGDANEVIPWTLQLESGHSPYVETLAAIMVPPSEQGASSPLQCHCGTLHTETQSHPPLHAYAYLNTHCHCTFIYLFMSS